MYTKLVFILVFFTSLHSGAQDSQRILLRPDRVFDGETVHSGWSVLVNGNQIENVGLIREADPGTKVIFLTGTTLCPGLIEGHSHLFLHPYNETSWDEQVLNESRTERTARAINHAAATLLAGFTTVRDLGTEGAGYDDVALKKIIEKGLITGPRMLVATRAIVSKGAYGPKSDNTELFLPQGAAEVGNLFELQSEVRTQIGKGADLIKIYADYRVGKNREPLPTFTTEELAAAVTLANGTGREVVVHAYSAEAMKRAVAAGVSTIEHGDNGNAEVFTLMKKKNVALCPTLSAGIAVAGYDAIKKHLPVDSTGIIQKRKSFALALKAKVLICMGGDVGVFAHGDNAREMETMVSYGMTPLAVLQSATAVNADVFGYGATIGRLKKGLLADMIAVMGDPSKDISAVRQIILVMKDGIIYKGPRD